MMNKFLAGVCLLISAFAMAQQSSYSPYSYYGLGEQRFKGTAEYRAMGGISFFADSIHVNLQNPAAFSALKLTTFSVGGTTSFADLSTEDMSQKAKRTTLDYLAVGLPFKKGGAVFGLMPYASTGYNLVNYSAMPSGDSTRTYYEGKGGINRVFAGAGYEITKNFRFGLSFNYNFGTVDTESREYIYGVQYGTRESTSSRLSGFSMDAGITYEGKIGKKLRVYGGLTYTPETKMTVKNQRYISLIEESNGGYSTIQIDTANVANIKVKMPSAFSVGGGIGKPRKWLVGAEVTFRNTAGQQSRFGSYGNVQFENAIKYGIGGYYIPNYNSFTSYLSRITYRAGAKYEKTGLMLNSKSIEDASGTVGLGFPVPGLFSNINLGVEYGKRGTVYSGLVQEQYVNVSIGLSFNDRWFLRRKYE
ncbi:hypothetical protein [Flavobacterium silvaticum]|uniref:Outer membrane protein n=1 Tax=Flavobacterium silvaticum TaxID=1852020 RepID=A0A972FK50_9FLAO|nr:hypothetical protein [Flavobacterium silvaticum]NMH27167.1 hypothetical protein [Flavobacterium silvaticum]